MSAAELNAGGEPVKNATYWKRQFNLLKAENEALKRQCAQYEELIASWNVDAIDTTQEHVEETGNNRHVFDWVCLSDSRIIEIRQINKPCDLTPWSDTLAFARALLREADAKREEVLWHFAVSGAFLNELMQMDQPSTGKWWIQ